MAITIHLDEVLKARGMTSKELCAIVGITEANLSILRSGKAKGVRFATQPHLLRARMQCERYSAMRRRIGGRA